MKKDIKNYWKILKKIRSLKKMNPLFENVQTAAFLIREKKQLMFAPCANILKAISLKKQKIIKIYNLRQEKFLP